MAELPQVNIVIIPPDMFSISTTLQQEEEEPSQVEEVLRLMPVFTQATLFPVPLILPPGRIISV